MFDHSAFLRPVRIHLILLMCAMLALSACASAPHDPLAKAEYERINDPLEPTNRAVFAFNSIFQSLIVRPLALVLDALPEGVQVAFSNFFTNLAEPRNVANALLQGDPKAAGTSLGRFITNSTIGLGGMINVTGSENHNPRDFGQTLARWTGDNGAYIQLPFIGASSVTHGIGFLVDGLYSIPKIQANRTDQDILPIAAGFANGVVTYSENLAAIDNIYKTSPDPYASFRNIYQQQRQKFVFGKVDELEITELE